MLVYVTNNSARVSFLIKLKASGLRRLPVNFEKFLRTPFLQNIPGGCFFILQTFKKLLNDDAKIDFQIVGKSR